MKPCLLAILLAGLAGALTSSAPAQGGGSPAPIAVRVTANPLPATDNSPVTFSIQVTNRGPVAVRNVSIRDRLPAGFAFLQSTPPGTLTGGDEGEEITIPIGTIPAGGLASATLVARPVSVAFGGNEATTVTNVAIVGAPILDGPVLVPLPVPIFVLRDFGDAPDMPYPTLRANNSARHRITALYLGATVDSEPNGQPTSTADGDDIAGAVPDDEDGVVFVNSWSPGGLGDIEVTASLAGVLDAWADFNQDGDWLDAGEHVINGAALPAGTSTFGVPIPAWAGTGRCYLRFRISPAGAPLPVGYSNSGEVEDYVVKIESPAGPNDAGDLFVQARGENIRITWRNPNALLQSSPAAHGPWVTMHSATSPLDLIADARVRFFRLIEGSAISRAGLDRRDFATLVRDADLVIDAVVTEVHYRNSDGDGTNDVSWPHTFVSVQVLDVLKGRVASSNLCLRFLGGLDADGERILKVSESTSFDVGERSILFVKRNGFQARPLVGAHRGRLRVVDGLVYSANGQRLVLTDNGRLAFGVRDALEEATVDRIGSQVLIHSHEGDAGESIQPQRPTGRHLTVAEFKSMLSQIIQQSHSPDELRASRLTVNTDSARAFKISRPRHRPPPSDESSPNANHPALIDPGFVPVAIPADDDAARVRIQDGNPVLRQLELP